MSTKTTYKQTELGLIPEDWEVKKLGDLGEFFKGKGVPKSNIVEEGKYKCLTYGDLYTKYDYVIQNVKSFLNEENILESQEIKYGDICIAGSGETLEDIGKCAVFIDDEIGYAGGDIIVFRSNENSLTLSYILNSDISKKQKYRLGQGHSVVHIYSSQLQNLKIPLPPLPEQKKIADCLSTWDCAIEKQSQLINALTQRKKALMQQLLTGKKRLPGFEGKWNLNSINDLFIFKNGKAHENDIDENGKYILVNSKFISTDGEISKKTNSNLAPLEVNDLVFVMSDVPNGKALAKFCLIKEDNLYTLNQRIGLLKIKKGNPIFMYYLLNRNSYFLMFDNGVGQTNLRKDDILDCPLNIPSLSEQTAIAEILATADRELTLQKEKLAQLQTQKKGLMQVLLTGKKRLLN